MFHVKHYHNILALTNQKGGVGKTTTAINLAACLAVAERKTLLIDLDPQGNATTGLGVNKEKLEKSIYQVLIGQMPIKEVVLPTELKFLKLVPANINLTGAELELVSMLSRETRLKQTLIPIQEDYDFIIIDCPPSLGLLTINSLTAAKAVIIPIQCEYYSLEGLGQLMKTIRLVKESVNVHLQIAGIVLTMYDSRTNLAQQVVSEVKKYFPDKVYKTLIPRNIRLSEAPGFGKPIILYDLNSKGAQAYLKLTKEVMNHAQKSAGEGPRSPHTNH